MQYFDAHTHPTFAAYDADREEVFVRAAEQGVGMNIVGTRLETSAAVVAAVEGREGVWASVGLHPNYTSATYYDAQELGEGSKELADKGEVFDATAYEALARHPKVVAIGECGLDYFRSDPITKEVQAAAFVQQIELANRVGKPLMLHIRPSKGSQDAYDDALELVKAHAKVPGDAHFFAGNWETARRWLDIGFALSFTGVLTFTHDYDEVVQNAPLDMLLTETDAPYVTPVPHRGERNEPVYVQEVVRAIARIRGEEEETVRAQVLVNARRLFGIT
ncbi:TatD family deoxyribonuclease [Candidatus Kaiserbacteria bacterium]|nr:TatD family deoxyribonuclease [Candidatus Kaiserbacteria bacterium]